jgi:4-amino-4-deoxy-L-arabinose transferase-like glycosyltransferase
MRTVIALTVLGAVLRFSTLDLQSFELDESVTAGEVLDPAFRQMLRNIAGWESAPPLYYVLAWIWTRPLGTGEVGLRSLSALIGTATVPVSFGVGATLVSHRAGAVLAALVALRPRGQPRVPP